MPKKLQQKQILAPEDLDSDDGVEVIEEEMQEDDSSMLEMVAMLKEYQKKKASKSSARASAFQAKKQALFAEARKNTNLAVTEGVTYIEQYKKTLMEIKASEVSAEQRMRDIAAMAATLDGPMDVTLSLFPFMTEELSRKRAAQVDEVCSCIEEHSKKRQLSRRQLIQDVKAEIEQQLEDQRTALDASALIKHYRSLLLSR